MKDDQHDGRELCAPSFFLRPMLLKWSSVQAVRSTAAGLRISLSRLSFQSEAYLHGDLEVLHLSMDNVAAGCDHFKPTNIADRFARLGNCIPDRLVDGCFGRSDDLDNLVNVSQNVLRSFKFKRRVGAFWLQKVSPLILYIAYLFRSKVSRSAVLREIGLALSE
jgi:hypothetical protein